MPVCLEKKITLAGQLHTYSCELVHYQHGFCILKYIIDRTYTIGGTTLFPGDITCALYWADRPYTLYIWSRTEPQRPIYYFNVADSISLKPEEVVWRDLVVDVLIDERGIAHVLDEHELPAYLDSDMRGYIEKSTQHILTHYPAILAEAQRFLRGGCK